jgi:hypothetical protein
MSLIFRIIGLILIYTLYILSSITLIESSLKWSFTSCSVLGYLVTPCLIDFIIWVSWNDIGVIWMATHIEPRNVEYTLLFWTIIVKYPRIGRVYLR